MRRRMVEKHLPHPSRDYCRICTLSEAARYGKGYAMGYSERQKARAVHGRISAAIPWPWASGRAGPCAGARRHGMPRRGPAPRAFRFLPS